MDIQRYDTRTLATEKGKRAILSGAVSHGGLLFISGQVADDTSADVAGQTAQILRKIDGLLQRAGIDKTRLLSVNIWIARAECYGEMNAVWDQWVPDGLAPARACIEAKLAYPQYTVEIGAIAAAAQAPRA